MLMQKTSRKIKAAAAKREKKSLKRRRKSSISYTTVYIVHGSGSGREHQNHTDRNVCHWISEVKLPQCEGDDRETITQIHNTATHAQTQPHTHTNTNQQHVPAHNSFYTHNNPSLTQLLHTFSIYGSFAYDFSYIFSHRCFFFLGSPCRKTHVLLLLFTFSSAHNSLLLFQCVYDTKLR